VGVMRSNGVKRDLFREGGDLGSPEPGRQSQNRPLHRETGDLGEGEQSQGAVLPEVPQATKFASPGKS